MQSQTKVVAPDDRQEIIINRDFELPVELLFKAYEQASILEQWMGTKVLKLENKRHGGWEFETTDPLGNKHIFHGTIHEFVKGNRFVRTFEMENTDFPAQLEFFEFQSVTPQTSRLEMRMIFRSIEDRDRMLQLPFAKGINMAHNTLETIMLNNI
ncbi:SRPBCC family protein [Jiulongibacter sediminis]|uniref:ATPase n=1 Tax=Jiulongibacter sediminis TaxID=1605367 RepID=A0A0P7CAF0_9BACT|nr:SRPBCC domain-containing protein [Jiulongibacter sediminis]KPM49638.1 ATPase [Jiulongibacter sediminis]TBX26676.1 ATPase [Jiulongibacter sediminis]